MFQDEPDAAQADTEKLITEPNPGDEETDTSDDDEENDLIVTHGDEAPPEVAHEEPAPKWVREVRSRNRELERQNRDLQRQLQATPAIEPNPIAELGPKPRLVDHDYDEDSYEAAVSHWFEKKRWADDAEAHARTAKEANESAWKAKLNAYGQSKAKMKVNDYEAAEHHIQQVFDVTQQGMVIQGADDPAVVVYYLGRNPAKAKEIAAIKDPVKFSFAVGKLESQLKVTSRKSPPPFPESSIRGSAPKTSAVDSQLERLREEAQKTGNADRLMAYKRAQAAKNK